MSTQASPPSTSGVKLQMDHVRKTFERDGNSISVLEDINLDVRNGEFICLVGPSGCGKSTLLNVMGGFLSPTSGSVAIDGEPFRAPTLAASLFFRSAAFSRGSRLKATSDSVCQNSRTPNANSASRITFNWSASKASSAPIHPIFPAA